MYIDVYAKSIQLLERVANSVYERDSKTPHILCFSTCEVKIVEKWIKEFMEEIESKN